MSIWYSISYDRLYKFPKGWSYSSSPFDWTFGIPQRTSIGAFVSGIGVKICAKSGNTFFAIFAYYFNSVISVKVVIHPFKFVSEIVMYLFDKRVVFSML